MISLLMSIYNYINVKLHSSDSVKNTDLPLKEENDNIIDNLPKEIGDNNHNGSKTNEPIIKLPLNFLLKDDINSINKIVEDYLSNNIETSQKNIEYMITDLSKDLNLNNNETLTKLENLANNTILKDEINTLSKDEVNTFSKDEINTFNENYNNMYNYIYTILIKELCFFHKTNNSIKKFNIYHSIEDLVKKNEDITKQYNQLLNNNSQEEYEKLIKNYKEIIKKFTDIYESFMNNNIIIKNNIMNNNIMIKNNNSNYIKFDNLLNLIPKNDNLFKKNNLYANTITEHIKDFTVKCEENYEQYYYKLEDKYDQNINIIKLFNESHNESLKIFHNILNNTAIILKDLILYYDKYDNKVKNALITKLNISTRGSINMINNLEQYNENNILSKYSTNVIKK